MNEVITSVKQMDLAGMILQFNVWEERE
jgi:hypothetical protein